MARNGSAQWNGTLQDGKGTLTVGDSAWTGNYSFKSRFEDGEGVVDIDGVADKVEDGSGVIVPAGARHNVRNTGDRPLKLYSIYGPPEHLDGIIHATKADAEKRHADEEWDGKTTE